MFWRSLYPFNFFLGAVFIFLACVYCALRFAGEFSLPESLRERIEEEAAEMGLALSFDKSFVGISGYFYASDVRLRLAGTPNDVFRAQKMKVNFLWTDLLSGKFSISSVEVFDGSVAPSYGDFDTEPVVSRLNMRIRKSGAKWRVDFLDFKIDSLYVWARGTVRENFSPDKMAAKCGFGDFMPASESSGKKEEKPVAAIGKNIDSFFAFFDKNKNLLDVFADPMAEVSFDLEEDEGFAEVVIGSPYAGYELSKDKLGENSSVRASGIRAKLLLESGSKSSSAKYSVFAGKVFCGKDFSAEGFSVDGEIVPQSGRLALKNFEAVCATFVYDGIEFKNLSVRNDWLDEKNYKEGWIVCAGTGGKTLAAQVDVKEDGRADIVAEGGVSPEYILSAGALAKIEEMRDFSFPSGIFLELKASLNLSKFAVRAEGSFDTGSAVIYRMPVKFARGEFSYDTSTNIFDARNLDVKSEEGWRVKGGFKQSFNDNRYFINVAGDIRPMAIAHFMEHWWAKVFSSVKFEGEKNFGEADAFVEGVWGKPENIWAFVGVKGKNASYNGSFFDNFSLKVWINPERITLFDVNLSRESRTAHAVLEWLYGSSGLTQYERQSIFLESNLNTSELASLGGREAEDVLEVVRFSEAPRLTLNAVLYNPSNNPIRRRDVFNAEIFAGGETQIENFAKVMNMRCEARSDGVATQITNASFGFCDGNGEGGVRVEKMDKGRIWFDADMRFDSMNQGEFVKFLCSLDPSVEGDSDNKEASWKIEMENGEVDLSAKLRGFTDDGASISGGGYVSLDNAELMRLNLFGALSRALSALKLPLGSFDLTYMKSPFEMEGGVVKFPQLEIGGDVMRIKGGAAYNFLKDDLTAAFFVSPFGGISKGLVGKFVSAINPITNIVEVEIKGTLDDPDVSIKMDPSHMLKSDKKIINGIREAF